MKLKDIYEDDLIDRFEQDLTSIELHFLHYEDNELNTCNKCNIIKIHGILMNLSGIVTTI